MKVFSSLIAVGVTVFLAGCAPEIRATIYGQDVLDVAANGSSLEVPMTLRVPQSSESSCTESLPDVVAALQQLFDIKGQGRCTSVGMNNFAEFETILVVERYIDRRDGKAPAQSVNDALNTLNVGAPLVYLGVEKNEGTESEYSLTITPAVTAEEVDTALRSRDKFRFLPSYDAPIFYFTVDNDTREKVLVRPEHAFVDSTPYPFQVVAELDRRGTVELRLSDVAGGYLQFGLPYAFASIKFEE